MATVEASTAAPAKEARRGVVAKIIAGGLVLIVTGLMLTIIVMGGVNALMTWFG